MQEPLFLPQHVTLSSWMAYAGMACILGAFIAETRGLVSSRAGSYLWLMAGGSALLAVRALHMQEWAFLILEVVWCAAALLTLWRPGSAR